MAEGLPPSPVRKTSSEHRCGPEGERYATCGAFQVAEMAGSLVLGITLCVSTLVPPSAENVPHVRSPESAPESTAASDVSGDALSAVSVEPSRVSFGAPASSNVACAGPSAESSPHAPR